jgi:fucose permease
VSSANPPDITAPPPTDADDAFRNNRDDGRWSRDFKALIAIGNQMGKYLLYIRLGHCSLMAPSLRLLCLAHHVRSYSCTCWMRIVYYFWFVGMIIGNFGAVTPGLKAMHVRLCTLPPLSVPLPVLPDGYQLLRLPPPPSPLGYYSLSQTSSPFFLYQDLSDTELGGIFLAGVGGAIIGLPVVVLSHSHLGTGLSTAAGTISLAVLCPIIGVPGPVWILIIGICALGFGMGWSDISVNGQAVILEKRTNSHKLGLCHCFYGLGGLSGALIGGAFLQNDVSILVDFGVCGAVCIIPCIVFSRWLYSHDEEMRYSLVAKAEGGKENGEVTGLVDIENVSVAIKCDGDGLHGEQGQQTVDLPVPTEEADSSEPPPREKEDAGTAMSSQDNKIVAGLCILGLLAYMGEGSIGDWSAIFLRDDIGTSPIVAALGIVAFQLCVSVGRYMSDTLRQHYSVAFILKVCGVLAAFGMGIVVLSPSVSSPVTAAVLGFAIFGCGLSMVSPLVIAAAGTSIKGMEPTEAIAYVSSMSYLGVLIG